MAYPYLNNVYSTAEIMLLDLDDSPALTVFHENRKGAIQDAHVDVCLGKIPGLADLKWRYITTTREWIPIFHLVDGQEEAMLAVLDLVPYKNPSEFAYARDDGWWITPKAYPRTQEE
jgi:hypothetical protein